MGQGKIKIALIVGIALSVLLHILGIWGYQQYWKNRPTSEVKNPIKVRMVSPSEFKKRQIVDIKPTDSLPPKDPKYAAEEDSFAQEETQRQGNQSEHPPTKDIELGQSPPSEPHSQYPDPSRLDATPQPSPNYLEMLPTFKELRQMELPGNNDHLEDVQKDSMTQLNASQWRFASFFTRVKQQVSRIWNPALAVKRYDPRGLLVNNRSYLTELSITIDNTGSLLATKIIKKSGVNFLDDEAVNAFETAAPFLNPPHAMFEGKERYTFQFGFYLDATSGLGFDLNWRP